MSTFLSNEMSQIDSSLDSNLIWNYYFKHKQKGDQPQLYVCDILPIIEKFIPQHNNNIIYRYILEWSLKYVLCHRQKHLSFTKSNFEEFIKLFGPLSLCSDKLMTTLFPQEMINNLSQLSSSQLISSVHLYPFFHGRISRESAKLLLSPLPAQSLLSATNTIIAVTTSETLSAISSSPTSSSSLASFLPSLPCGKYLIRLSESKPGCLTISYLASDNETVKNVLVYNFGVDGKQIINILKVTVTFSQ